MERRGIVMNGKVTAVRESDVFGLLGGCSLRCWTTEGMRDASGYITCGREMVFSWIWMLSETIACPFQGLIA